MKTTRKHTKQILGVAAVAMLMFTGCQDMLETESGRVAVDPELNEKTDSMFYTLGILKALQEATDRYVLTNELRGDLAEPTANAETDLKELACFNVTEGNKYDSAYTYYRVINNCNYYIAHRDTTLATGSRKVAMLEYVEAKAVRAWTYMQLAKTYGSVPFYTDPLTMTSDVEEAKRQPRKSLADIVEELAPDLEQYSGYGVPNYSSFDAGTSNSGESKTVATKKMMLPVDLVLGDLYLETNQYEKAARHYASYLMDNRLAASAIGASAMMYADYRDLPSDFSSAGQHGSWANVFASGDNSENVTIVPFATNRLRGTVTELPELFGYNYYSTADGQTYNSNVQIGPSQALKDLVDGQQYYYTDVDGERVKSLSIGDMRYYAYERDLTIDKVSFSVMTKFNSGNVPLYRSATIWLRLAEAINRMGYPDAAFAILKDGMGTALLNDTTYMTEESKEMLQTVVPLLSSQNRSIFNPSGSSESNNYGLHSRGCGITAGQTSPYQMSEEVGKKLDELVANFNLTLTATKADTINAMEDLICDEYALELAFEGNRFGDLCRLARHKNEAAVYSAGFGGQWLAFVLSRKNAQVDLTKEENWYLPLR